MLYIRTDMNDIIATGHVMRCLSIADAARILGETVTFILADDKGAGYIQSRGYEVIILGTQWNDMESELSVLLSIIRKRKIQSILIDSYQVTDSYLRTLSAYVKTIYIDDLNKFIYPVNMLICYANYWEKFEYEKRYENTKLLLGTKYMPLRESFSNIGKKYIKKQIETIMLLSGGSDKYNVLESVLERVKEKKFKHITVICGRYYLGYENLVEKYKSYKNIYIYQSVENIEQYMKEVDLAISAGGTTLYELCACGTPTISYSFVDNQLDNVRQFEKDGMIDYAGDVRCDDVVGNIERLLEKILQDEKLRKERFVKMQELIDGKGAERIVREWKNLENIDCTVVQKQI